jgi:hypothetical protein
MHKIPPLQALILAATKRGQSSPQLVIETRVWVAISIGPRNGYQRNPKSTQYEGLLARSTKASKKLAPPIGAKAAHPEIENLQHCASHTWLSTQATPTTGFR